MRLFKNVLYVQLIQPNNYGLNQSIISGDILVVSLIIRHTHITKVAAMITSYILYP